MKSKIIKHYGGSVMLCAKELGLSWQRVSQWPDDMSKGRIDGVIAALVRKGLPIPKWLLK